MRDRVLLTLAVVLLVAGLGAWALVAREQPNDDRALYLASMDPPPPIGAAPRDGDARAAGARSALEAVGLGSSRVLELFVRDGEPIFGVATPGRDAVSVYDALAAAHARTGLVPLLLGDGHAYERHAEAARTTLDPPHSIVRRAEHFDVEAWASARLGERATATGTPREVAGDSRERFPAIGDPLLSLPLHEIAVALVPAASGADALAWLAFGNWRGCPDPTTHVAMLRALRERAGAEVVAVSADRIDLRVASPPSDAAGRLALARLLSAYAPSVLSRATGSARTLEDVAAEIVPSRVWSLHWPRP